MMCAPERELVRMMDVTRNLSRPASAAARIRRGDQTVSPRWLAPFWVAQKSVPLGHGLEILTILWGAIRAMDPSFGSKVLNPMGGRQAVKLNPNVREPGHAAA